MLFKKDIEPSCSYCINGSRISDTQVACLRRGIVSAGGQCRSFKYDPLKRDPPHPGSLNMGNFSQDDFSLE